MLPNRFRRRVRQVPMRLVRLIPAFFISPMPGFPSIVAGGRFRIGFTKTIVCRILQQPLVGRRVTECTGAGNQIDSLSGNVFGVAGRRNPLNGLLERHPSRQYSFKNLLLVPMAPKSGIHFKPNAGLQCLGSHRDECVTRCFRHVDSSFPGQAGGQGHKRSRVRGSANATPLPGRRHFVGCTAQFNCFRLAD